VSADRIRNFSLLLLATLLLGGCDAAMRVRDDIFSDFKKQPRIEPWDGEFRGDSVGFPGNPQMSVPITGSVAPGYMISYTPTLGALDSLSRIENPVAASAESLERGRRLYQVNCTVCHGAAGAGDGPVLRYGLPVPTLVTGPTLNLTDGYIFGIMRNGRGLMPNYRRIPEEQRWDVVNYIRGLQGTLGVTVSTEPGGVPGEGGAAVPGASATAPTRPVPHFQRGRETLENGTPASQAGGNAPAEGVQP
jgi:mono/diheme cytochrome c family protein